MSARPAHSASRDRAPVRVVFFGSGGFAVPSLEALLALPDMAVVGVVSAPDRPAGRAGTLAPTPVTTRAREAGLPILQPPRVREPAAVEAIAALAPDLGVVADYGQLIPPVLLEVPQRGILNVHPSLLPRHRGATPVAATIIAADSETGVTVIAMDAGLDSGPIVAVERWPLSGTETAPEIESEAAIRGGRLLAGVVAAWAVGDIEAVAQDEAGATLTRPFRREDGRLDPGRPAGELERRVRALAPWPGTFLDTPLGRLGVHRVAVGETRPFDRAGALVADGDGLALVTPDGRLRLLEAQLAGGRRMTAAELRRGAGRHLV